jgi:hypothetical protein
MKTVMIILLLFAYTVNAQVKVNEIRMKFGSEYHKAKEPDVVFPVMSTGNKAVDDKINFLVIKDLTGEDSISNFSTTLFRAMNDGLSELDYTITLNTKGVLSYRLDALGCGAYCEPYSIYFNFDLHTGELLKIQDVIRNEMLDSFRTAVLRHKVSALKTDLKEKDCLLSAGQIDSADHNFVLEYIKQCMKEVNTDKFLLLKNELQIVDACEFPHAVKALQPVYELKYSYKRIRKFFNPSFVEKLNTVSL